ncbi:MAG TPA: hypothetical protein VID72_01155 [Ktedonobacterales bacterium]
MGLGQAAIACTAHASDARGLRERAFASCAQVMQVIARLECRRLLALARGQQRLVTLLRKAQRHAAARRPCIRARRADETALADRLGEEYLHHRLPFGVLGAMPADAVLPLRAGDALVPPIHGELGDIERAGRARLPAGVGMHGSNQVNRMRVAAV